MLASCLGNAVSVQLVELAVLASYLQAGAKRPSMLTELSVVLVRAEQVLELLKVPVGYSS